ARVFLGDVGSYLLGSLIAMTAFLALDAGAPPLAVFAPAVLYVADAGLTLVRRIVRGEAWWKPHREHVYQHLANDHLGHTVTTLLVCGLTLVISLAGLLTLATDELYVRVLVGLAMAAALAVYLPLPRLLATRVPAAAE